ncbi:MAG: hypothetical protein K2N30_04780 [Clostridia bacterium]|nr:hypothetical protein [Clostridia bacterium]
MKSSALYEFIGNKLIYDLRDRIEATDDGLIKRTYITDKEKLEAMLDGDEKEQLRRFIHSMENWLDYIYYQIDVDLINMGVKIGMELQESFDKFREQELI